MANTSAPINPSGLMGAFKLDKKDLDDIKQAIVDSRKQSLADALAVFAGRAKSVIDFAGNKISQFEQGYFVAQLGGISGKDMRALEAVAQDFGVSAEAVRNSVQALHRNVRDDPTVAVLLEQLHISTSDGAGGQRNSADLLLALSETLKRMAPEQARETGERLGVDAGFMEAVRNADFAPRLSAQRDVQEDSKIEAAGERAHQVMATVRELSRSVDEMFAQALLTMGPRLQQVLEGISAWFKDNGQEAGKRIGEVGNFVLSILSLLGPVVSVITWLDGATGGLSSQILLLVGGFLLLGGGGVVGALVGLVSRLGGMRSIIGGLGRHLVSMANSIGSFVSRAWSATGNFVSGLFGRMTTLGRAAATQMGSMASAVWSWMGNMAARGGALVVDSVKAAGTAALRRGQSLWESAGSWIGRIVNGAKVLARGVASSPAAVGLGIGSFVSRAWSATGNFVSGLFGRMTTLGRAAAMQMGSMASAVWSWMGNMAARGGALVVDSVKAAGAAALRWGQSLWESAAPWIGRIVDGAKVLARGVASSPAAVGLGLALYPRSLGDGTLKSLQGEERFRPGQPEPDFTQPGRGIRPSVMEGALVEPWRDYRSGFATSEAAGGVLAPMSAPAAPVSVNATTHVYVNGSADPTATGYAVANQQSRVNADLTRNLQGSYD